MPSYLRLFYYKKLVEVKKAENDAHNKASKGKSSSTGIKRPSFNKPSGKSP